MKRLVVISSMLLLGMLALPMIAAAAPSGELEIFSWWAGDEGPALEKLIDLYEGQYPDIEVINATVTGGAGVNAKAVLKTRMLGGDPPDTFQVHAGQELLGTWVIADRMEDLSDLYEEEGLYEVLPDSIIDALSTDEGIWAVPIGVHRSNVMWYVPDNLEKWGVEPPSTWEEFLEIAPELEAQGVVPLSVAQSWTVQQVWENVAVSKLGPDKWQDLWSGDLSFTSPEMIEVWDLFGRIIEYTNPAASSLSWQQASDMVLNGEAAFNIMGDWAAGYFTTTKGLEPGEGFGWATSPGTEGTFVFLSDAFGLPVGSPHPENTVAWLKLLASREAQDAFSVLKGSISARSDSDLSVYNEYSQSAAADWNSDVIVGSLAHGAVANERFMNSFATVMDLFLGSHSSEVAANASAALAAQAGIGR